MYKLLRIYLLFMAGIGLSLSSVKAQAPEQDCFNALPVCQSVFQQAQSYQGEGNNPNEINPLSSCLGTGENNDVWYIFTVQQAGNLCFTITPNAANDDYDWALYDLTNASCSDIATNPALEVSCNFSANIGCGGATGANGQQAGPCGGQNEPCVPVSVGQTFVLNVSNFSSSQSGYTLDFTASTAVIFDNIPPQLQPVTVPCGSSNIEVSFSENVLCNTVQASDFILTGPAGVYTITNVTGANCAAGGTFEDLYTMSISPAPVTGSYTLTVVNNITDNCGNICPINSQTTFNISLNTALVTASPDQICAGEPSVLSNNFSNTPGYQFVWNPGALVTPTITVSPAATTIYTCSITDPNGCVINGQTTVVVKPTPSASFNVSSNATCAGTSVTANYTGIPSAGAGYSWYFGTGGQTSPTSPFTVGPYTVSWNTAGTETIFLQVSENGCLDSSSQTVSVAPPVTASLAVPDSICINSANNITYTGTYTNNVTTLSWDFGGAVVVNGGTGLGPHTVSWTTPGTYTVCVTAINAGCPPSTACKQVVVLAPPVASIQPVADQCLDGNNFNFSFTGTANFNSIFWDFGSSAVPPNMTGTPFAAGIQYQNPGPKIVTVFVNKYGCSSNLASITFDVLEEPDANFVIGNGAVCQGGCLSFNYSGVLISDPSLMTYSWDFGPDANPQFSTLDSVPCVVFNSPGAHSIKLLVTNSGICKDSLVQSVFVHPNPQVTAGIDRSFCDGSGPIQLDASVSGGTPNTTTPNYYYSWWSNPAQGGISNPAVEDPQVNPLANCVEYYFQVQDVVGCRSNIDTAEVCVLPLPLASAGGDRIVCAGASAPGDFLNGGIAPNNQAPLPMTYSWYPTTGMAAGQGSVPNPYVNPGTTTIYTLFLTSANGCTSVTTTLDTVSTTTVTVNPVPLVDAGPHKEICYLDNVLLEGYASGAGPNYSYQWSPNDLQAGFANVAAAQVQTPTVAPQFTHIYTLEVTSNGCKASDTVSVTVHTLPTASIEPPSTDICQGQSITLNGLADGDPTGVLYGYSWSPSTGLSTNSQGITVASPLTTTTYNLYVSSQYCDGFADAIQVIVNPTPTPFISQIDTLLCYGDTIHLHSYYNFNGTGPTANPILYEWSPAEGLSDAFISNPIAEPTQTTTYYVSISVAGQCPKKDSVTFIVTPPINAQITADTTLICSAGSTTLTASGGSGSPAYSWSPATLVSDATSQVTTATPTTTTTYTLTITEGFCSDTDNVTIQVNRSPVADYVASHNRGCDTLLVNFMEQAQYETQYIWNFGDGSPTVNEPNPTHLYTQAGTYPVSLTVTGPGGCQDVAIMDTVYITDAVGNAGFTSSVAVNQPLVTPDAVIDFVDTSHHSISWLWDFGDGTTSSDPNPTHTYQNEGEYTVTLTVMNEDGCITSVTKTPYTVVAPGLNVPNVFTPNGDGSYDTWQVVYNGKEDILIEVFDRWGTPLFSSNTTQKAWNGADKRGFQLNDGVYFYSIKVGKKIYTGNVTIVK